MKTAYLVIGSNLDKEKNMALGVNLVQKAVTIINKTDIFNIPSFDMPKESPSFLNMAMEIQTINSPLDLKFKIFRKIEQKLGRIRTKNKFESRPFDIDIILYEDEIINSSELTVPDPSLLKYPFVSFLLNQLIPDKIIPDQTQSIKEIYQKLHRNNNITYTKIN